MWEKRLKRDSRLQRSDSRRLSVECANLCFCSPVKQEAVLIRLWCSSRGIICAQHQMVRQVLIPKWKKKKNSAHFVKIPNSAKIFGI